jgi:hypothetical protein
MVYAHDPRRSQRSSSGWRVISHSEAHENLLSNNVRGAIQILFLEQTMIHEHIDSVNRNLLAPVFDSLLFGRIHLTRTR